MNEFKGYEVIGAEGSNHGELRVSFLHSFHIILTTDMFI